MYPFNGWTDRKVLWARHTAPLRPVRVARLVDRCRWRSRTIRGPCAQRRADEAGGDPRSAAQHRKRGCPAAHDEVAGGGRHGGDVAGVGIDTHNGRQREPYEVPDGSGQTLQILLDGDRGPQRAVPGSEDADRSFVVKGRGPEEPVGNGGRIVGIDAFIELRRGGRRQHRGSAQVPQIYRPGFDRGRQNMNGIEEQERTEVGVGREHGDIGERSQRRRVEDPEAVGGGDAEPAVGRVVGDIRVTSTETGTHRDRIGSRIGSVEGVPHRVARSPRAGCSQPLGDGSSQVRSKTPGQLRS